MKTSVHNKVEKLKTGWYLWLFPVIALLISGWLLYKYESEQGERIQILFDDATGIQPEKTKVRHRGVMIGTVKDVHLSKDQKDVVVEVVLRKDASNFAVEGSKFSLITPKIGFQGISGLETIMEGGYIAVLPGKPEAPSKHEFKAQPAASTDPLDDTSAYLIEADNAESVSTGDAVTFRGVKIGSVSKITIPKNAQKVNVQINVENRYTRLIRTNTVFWRKVAVQAKFSLFGGDIKVNSMDAIMNGGIELATPNEAGAMAKALEKFTLAPGAPKDVGKWNPSLE